MATQLTVILASGSLVDIDGTLFVQLSIFLLMLIVLRFLLFGPVIRIIEARREATVGALKTASNLQKEATELTASFNAKMNEVRTKAAAERAAILDRAKQNERQIIGEAKAHTDRVMTEMRAQADVEMKDTVEKLKTETRTMAELLVEKVLDRSL